MLYEESRPIGGSPRSFLLRLAGRPWKRWKLWATRGAPTRQHCSPPIAILSGMRLDEERLGTLRRWGEALIHADSEERAAAGRAILMLLEEIDQLQAELGRTHQELSQLAAASSDETKEALEEPASTLQERVYRVLRRDSGSGSRGEPLEEVESHPDGDEMTTSARSWIEGLRRQE